MDVKPKIKIIVPETARKRKALFKRSKPFIRPFSMDDLWVFWAGYKEGSFPALPQDMTKDQFYEWLLAAMSKHHEIWVVEDINVKFKAKRGIVCFIAINREAGMITPNAEFFSWATKANVLRVNVRYFNMIRYAKDVGVCVVKSLKDTANLFHHVRKYGVLTFIGRIPGGDPYGRGDLYMFSVMGKKFYEEKHNGVSSNRTI